MPFYQESPIGNIMVFLFQMRIIEIIFLPERSTEFESGNVIGAFVIIGQRKK